MLLCKRKDNNDEIIICVLLSLAACGAKAEPKTDNVVTMQAWDAAFSSKAANVTAVICKTSNPDVTIEVVSRAQDDIVQQLNPTLAAGSYKGLPEVVLVED